MTRTVVQRCRWEVASDQVINGVSSIANMIWEVVAERAMVAGVEGAEVGLRVGPVRGREDRRPLSPPKAAAPPASTPPPRLRRGAAPAQHLPSPAPLVRAPQAQP